MLNRIRGFTIIELLLVIVIIGVVTAVSIVSYSGAQRRAAHVAILSDTQRIHEILEGEYMAEESYPPELSGIGAAPSIDSAVYYVTNAEPFPIYSGLDEDQNAQLLLQICNQVANATPYDAVLDLCQLSGKNFLVKGDDCNALIHGPIESPEELQIDDQGGCEHIDDPMLAAASDDIREKFEQQGGTYPIVIPTGKKNQPSLPEPEIIQSRASDYCLQIQSAQHLSLIVSITSMDLKLVSDECSDTLPPLREDLKP